MFVDNNFELTSDGLSWESCSGLLSAAVHLLPDFSANQLSEVTRLALNHLDHDESRVRQNSGDLLANVAAHAASPPTLFLEIFDTLVGLIKRDLSRDPAADELPENEKVRQKIIDGQKTRGGGGMSSKDIFHESAGWRHLETSMMALRKLFELNKNDHVVQSDLFQVNMSGNYMYMSCLQINYSTIIRTPCIIKYTKLLLQL